MKTIGVFVVVNLFPQTLLHTTVYATKDLGEIGCVAVGVCETSLHFGRFNCNKYVARGNL